MKERAVKDAVRRLLTQRGAYFYMPVPTGYGATSIDFFVCYKGHFIGVETKRPGVNKVTARQDSVLEQIVDAGGQRVLENDTTCPELKRVLDAIDGL